MSMTDLAHAIRAADTEADAQAAIAGLRRSQLVALAAELSVHHRANDTVATLRQLIVFHGCRRGLIARAISRGGKT